MLDILDNQTFRLLLGLSAAIALNLLAQTIGIICCFLDTVDIPGKNMGPQQPLLVARGNYMDLVVKQ